MTWFEDCRLDWIKETAAIYGFINRAHVQKKFGISIVQASLDLSKVQQKWPDLLVYDKRTKRYLYRAAGKAQTDGDE